MKIICKYEQLEDGRWKCTVCGDETSTPREKPPIRTCGELPDPPPPTPPPGYGPGTELKKILAAYAFSPSAGCGCDEFADQMDRWGPEGCADHRAEIVAFLQSHYDALTHLEKITAAAKAMGASFRPSPLDPVGSIVDEAIRRATEPTG